MTAAVGPAQVHVEVVDGPAAVVEIDGGVLTVAHEPERWIGSVMKRAQAVVTVTVPADTPTVIRTVSGDVFVAGLRDGVSINTVSGAVTATDVAGSLTLRTVSGEIQGESVDGHLDLNTVSGHCTVTGRLDELTARAVSGDLTFDIGGAPASSLTTVSGDVVMRLPEDAALDLDVTTVSGHLDSAFAVLGTSSKRRLAGSIGSGGGPRVSVRTMSGDVALLRKELSAARAGALGPGPAGGET